MCMSDPKFQQPWYHNGEMRSGSSWSQPGWEINITLPSSASGGPWRRKVEGQSRQEDIHPGGFAFLVTNHDPLCIGLRWHCITSWSIPTNYCTNSENCNVVFFSLQQNGWLPFEEWTDNWRNGLTHLEEQTDPLEGMELHLEEWTDPLGGTDWPTWRNGPTHLEEWSVTWRNYDPLGGMDWSMHLEQCTDTLWAMDHYTCQHGITHPFGGTD